MSASGHMLCVSILLKEEENLRFISILLHMAWHVAIFYKIIAGKICGKYTYLQDVSDLKLNLCVRK